MECVKMQDDLLPAYVFNDLDKEMKEKVKAHLLTCTSCQEELASLKKTVKLVKSAEIKKAPAGLLESLFNICPLDKESMWEKIKQRISDFLGEVTATIPELAGATRGEVTLQKVRGRVDTLRPVEVKSDLPINIYLYNRNILGFIFDKEYQPISKIKVVMERYGIPSYKPSSARTDLDGMFIFKNCSVGRYTLIITIPERESIKVIITIS